MSPADDLLIRFGSFAFAGFAIAIAIVQLDRENDQDRAALEVVKVAPDEDATDPLAAELARCRALTDPEAIDEACRHAWAERRTRFFGQPTEVQP